MKMANLNGFQIEVLPAAQMDPGMAAAWESLRADLPGSTRPFFSAEYTRLLGQVTDNTEVGIVQREGRIHGVFPFQRIGRSAYPVGGSLTDFQGILMREGTPFGACDLLRGCGLDAWNFRYLIDGWSALDASRFRRLTSPAIGLSRGFETFEQDLAERGSDLLYRTNRRIRSLAKRVGPVRLELDSRSWPSLERLLDWKADQHKRGNTRNGFGPVWVRSLLDRICSTHEPSFGGLITCLHAGDHFVAGALALRSGPTLHVWLTAFNPEFSKYSPGMVCMVELIRAAASTGVTKVDLGHGDEPFKHRFGTVMEEVAEGCVDRRWLVGWANRRVYQAREALLDGRLRPWLQNLKRKGRQLRTQWSVPAATGEDRSAAGTRAGS
jgi:CelD/BcsL family acetyltransferase involved in cellulose biosynthesis